MKMKKRVLAVLALALLMINMAPVKRVEAATSIDVMKNIYSIPLKVRKEYQHCIVAKNDAVDSVVYAFLWNGEPAAVVRYGDSAICPAQTGIFEGYVSGRLYKLVNDNFVYRTDTIGFCGTKDSSFYMPTILYSSVDIYMQLSTTTYHFIDEEQLLYNADAPLEPKPLVLPVTEPDYPYWLYHKTTNGEYMYWSKDPFELEVSEGKYILHLSTGDIVYRLHLKPSHIYYRQVLSGSVQYVISPGDIFRSSHDLLFDGITIDAWTEGDVTSEEVHAPQYNIPHITKFLKRVRTARSYGDKPREYSISIDLELSGDFDAAVTEQKVLIDGNYIMPSEDYFYLCDSENIEPSTTHFMEFVKSKQEKYYIYVDWSHIESIVNLAGLTSDYGFRLTYSNAVDALIERGEFDVLYSKSIQAAYDDDIRRLCCPYRLACTLIGVVDGEYYYGDTYITVLYSELDKSVADVSGVYSDYVSLDNNQRTDAIESTINAAQDDKLQDYIDKKDAELDALIEEYEMKLATLDGSLASGGSGDLFGTFSRIANGVSGLSGSFRSIATAVGNVFAFFPDEITTILYAGFIALIVIAVYKALRG